jgi:hypothetical protein
MDRGNERGTDDWGGNLMATVTGYMIGRELCDALGLDIAGVRTIDLHVAAKEAVTVKVERLVKSEQARAMNKVLEEYTLIPRASIINNFEAWFGAACARAGV